MTRKKDSTTSTSETPTSAMPMNDIALPGTAIPAIATTRLEQQVVGGCKIDNGYEVWGNGVYKRKSFSIPVTEGVPPLPSLGQEPPSGYARAHLEKIAGDPVYVSAIGRRMDDDIDLIGLTYLKTSRLVSRDTVETKLAGGIEQNAEAPTGDLLHDRVEEWETLWVTNDQIADPRKLLELSRLLFPVRGSTSKIMSDFLMGCVDANKHTLPAVSIVRRAGHHSVGGKHGWLVGKTWVGQGEVMPSSNQDKLSRALRTSGSEREWIEFVRAQWGKDNQSWIIRWLLGTSFTAPLLRFVGERTFFVHQYTQSHGGKTLLGLLGQSAWGHPREFSMALNRATQNAITEVFKYVSDLPILLDEMQGKEVDVSNFIMQACTEEHKQRVKQEGRLVEETARSWRTLIRTTGEQTLAGADNADLGGQESRVLEIRHPGITPQQGVEIWQWIEASKHYGHAGLHFLQQLSDVVHDEERLDKLRKRFNEFTLAIATYTGKSRALERQVGAIALGEALMLRWVFGMDAKQSGELAMRDALDIVTNWMRMKDGSSTLGQQAAEFLVEHRAEYPAMYADVSVEGGLSKLSTHGTKSSMPIVAAVNAGKNREEIWYFPTAINRVLRDRFNCPPGRIWEDFVVAGILDPEKERLPKSRTLRGVMSPTRVYVVFADRLAQAKPEVTEIDVTELSSYIPCADEWWDE